MHLIISFRASTRLCALFLAAALAGPLLAGTPQTDLRQSFWDELPFSTSEHRRHLCPSGRLLLRIPSDWQQPSESESRFTGPEGVEFTAFVEEIPDGLPLKSFLAALLRHLQSLPGAEDVVQIRPVQLAGREGREVLIELVDSGGQLSRRIIWCIVDGPTAISLLFVCPASAAAEYEPHFKSIVESASLLEKRVIYEIFASRLKQASVEERPVRIDHVQRLIATLDGHDEQKRQVASSELAELAATDPNPVLDLLLDSRTLLRAAAVEALGRTRSSKLAPFLVAALADTSPLVAARAARKLVEIPGGIEHLRQDTTSWTTGDLSLFRVAPFLPHETQAEIARALFKMGKSGGQRTDASIRNPYFELGLQLAARIPARHLPLPLPEIISAGHPGILSLALEVAARRKETVNTEPVIALLRHADRSVAVSAAGLLAVSGDLKDIPELERIGSKSEDHPSSSGDQLKAIISATIEKIRFRKQLASLSGAARRQLIQDKLGDERLAEWVWFQYGAEEFERQDKDDQGPSRLQAGAGQQIEPLGQNLIPRNVSLYTAVPDPSGALQKVDTLMSGVQLPSARDQAGVVLLLSQLKGSLAHELGTTIERLGFGAVGVAPHAPAVFAAWRPKSAPATVKNAERSAVLLRVTDRGRFEAALTKYHSKHGHFRLVAPGAAVVTRFISLLPALMPPLAEALLLNPDREGRQTDAKTEPRPVPYTSVFFEECEGREVMVVDRRNFLDNKMGDPDTIYVAYTGDTAILASDRHSLRDLLVRLRTGEDVLAEHETFRKVAAGTGEALYLSDLEQIQDRGAAPDEGGTEFGVLRVSADRIENEYHLAFGESSKEEPFEKFRPEKLEAPTRLLPASTSLFILMRFNPVSAWPSEMAKLLQKTRLVDFQSLFKLDLESEVLPELGPECGAALVGPIVFQGKEVRLPWLAFFALRSPKLVEAAGSGGLFNGEADDRGVYRFQVGSTDLVAAIKDGYLVVAPDHQTLAALEDEEKLAASRDYQRCVEKTGDFPLVVFGGLNTQATRAIRPTEMDVRTERVIALLDSFGKAFHSHTLSADGTTNTLDVRLSVSTGQEGRYSVSELSTLVGEYEHPLAVIEAQGLPVLDMSRAEAVRLRIRVKATEGADRVARDIATQYQSVNALTDEELTVKIQPRRVAGEPVEQLPVRKPELEPYLKPTHEIRSDNPEIRAQAQQIAGEEKNAWAAACKLSDWVFTNLKWKLVQHVDAVETLTAREADCLELSQLYLALARSLGLPARLVTGLAYQDGTFTGHAWVEVFVGTWVEMDPTFGTHFVDAGHLRESSGQLLMLGALNLVEIEIVEVEQPVYECQRDARKLLEQLAEELTAGKTSLLWSVLNPAALVAEYLSPLDWEQLSSEDRRRFASAYRRAVNEVSIFEGSELRLLSLKVEKERARGLALQTLSQDLYFFDLALTDGTWHLVEVVQSDTHAHLVREALGPVADLIRKGEVTRTGAYLSPYSQVLLAMARDNRFAGELADRFLNEAPDDTPLRFLKALTLLYQEKKDEARLMLEALAREAAPLPAALLKLGGLYEEAEADSAIAIYRKYLELVPGDPRPHQWMAWLYEQQQKLPEAEGEYREAIQHDSRNSERHLDLAYFYASQDEYSKALEVVNLAEVQDLTSEELFSELIARFSADEVDKAVRLAEVEPDRMKRNADANIYLGRLLLEAGRGEEALAVTQLGVDLDPQNSFGRASLAEILRSLKRYQEAVEQAERACEGDPERSFARYNLACALAMTGRKEEALEHLKKVLEKANYFLYQLPEERDLTPLSGLPEFERLLQQARELSSEEDR